MKPFNHKRFMILSRLVWLWRLPMTIGEFYLLRANPAEYYRGIALLDNNPLSRPGFVGEMRKALDMVLSNDSLRFNRIIREIKYVLHVPCHSSIYYSRPLKFCWIDLKNLYAEESPEALTENLACALIWAATLAHLEGYAIINFKSNYVRIEKLLRREYLRFAKRHGIELLDSFVDEVGRAPLFKEKLQWWKEDVRRMRNDDYRVGFFVLSQKNIRTNSLHSVKISA